MAKICFFILMLATVFTACSANKDIIDNNIGTAYYEVDTADNHIDMSLIDFSNIEFLFGQPLPVIKKCMEGEWKLIRITSGWDGDRVARDGEYMNLTNGRIIIGSNTHGVETDSPSTWEKIEKYYGNLDAYILVYNVRNGPKSIRAGDYLFPVHIKNDTLVVNDFIADGCWLFYTKLTKEK